MVPGCVLLVAHTPKRQPQRRLAPLTSVHPFSSADAVIPVVRIVAAPRDDSAETFFAFRSDDAGVLFEAQLERIEEDGSTTVVFPWTSTVGDMSLDEDEELETGQHVMKVRVRGVRAPPPGQMSPRVPAVSQVRAVDPAGNVNQEFEEGINKHSWYYRPDLPWVLIILGSLGFIALVVGVALEIRRRRKKRAMERYAIKRMRRKFKGIKKDAAKKDVDWRKVRATAPCGWTASLTGAHAVYRPRAPCAVLRGEQGGCRGLVGSFGGVAEREEKEEETEEERGAGA